MEVGRWLVYPHQIMLGDVQIKASSYAVVKMDMVHENLNDLKLEVPPDDTTLTLWDTVTRRVQWKTFIDVDSLAAASASNISSQLNTAPDSIFPETCPSPIQDQPHPSPPHTRSSPIPLQTQPSTAVPKATKNACGKSQPRSHHILRSQRHF
jgi:hypothetical protein